MRPRTIAFETLCEIHDRIEDGTYRIQAAAKHYNIPAPTLYRNLREIFGKIEVKKPKCVYKPDPQGFVLSFMEANGIKPEGMTLREKMTKMDQLAGLAPAALLCRIFGVASSTFSYHRRLINKGQTETALRLERLRRTIEEILNEQPADNRHVPLRRMQRLIHARTGRKPTRLTIKNIMKGL